MFGFNAASFKEQFNEIQDKINDTTFEFIVDDIAVVVKSNQIFHLHWKVEPTPDELMAAINQAFIELSELITKIRETAEADLLANLPEPVKTIVNNQLQTLLHA